jgi:predicted adenine nucleotide alpha hydrolase (AANH) superfamily ATPase
MKEKSGLVLMSCCAPCSAAAIRRLKEEGADFAVLFYNPNIFPRAEYDKRLSEQINFCKKLNVKFAAADWDHELWLSCVHGLEKEPERGRRCAECFKMRAKFGAKWAKDFGYDKITSCFGAAKYKNRSQVDAAFEGTPYIKMDFDYDPGPDMYRQKYCGCEFSRGYEKYYEA